MHSFHATPEITLWVLLGPLLAGVGAYFWISTPLSAALTDLGTRKPYLADFLPSRSLTAPGFGWWIWTSQHLQLQDRTITRAIYRTRVAQVVLVLLFLLLFLLQDTPERLATWLNSRGF